MVKTSHYRRRHGIKLSMIGTIMRRQEMQQQQRGGGVKRARVENPSVPAAAVVQSLQAALEANRRLQEQILHNLHQVSLQKQRNREAALVEVSSTWKQRQPHDDDKEKILPCHAKVSEIVTFANTDSSTEHDDDADPTSHAVDPNDTILQPKAVDRNKARQFQFQADRMWRLPYFIDPTGSKPLPNADTLQRETLRESLRPDIAPSSSAPRRLSKAQGQYLLELISKHGEEEASIDWTSLAQALCDKFPLEAERSVWDCVCYFIQHTLERQKTTTSSSPIMTLQHDEILFRFLALQGPQYVWDYAAAGSLSNIIGNASVQQVWIRSNATSSLNPKLASDPYWNKEQERKLVLLMKVYHAATVANDDNGEEDDDDEDQKEASKSKTAGSKSSTSSIFKKVAMHFPNRTRDQIFKKWQRSLDPALDHEPWTPQEDQELKQVVRNALAVAQRTNQAPPRLADLTRPIIFARKTHQIYARWLEIATPEEIVAYDAWQLLAAAAQDNAGVANNNSTTTTTTPPILTPDQFRLEWKG